MSQAANANASAIAQGRKRMEELIDAADSLYTRSEYEQAGDLYRRACEIADAIGAREEWFQYRLWWAESRRLHGRLREAFVLVEPLLKDDDTPARPADRSMAVQVYTKLVINLPVALATIEKTLERAETLALDSGVPKTLSVYTHLRARLALWSGEYDRAETYEEEAWAIWSSDYPNVVADHYFVLRSTISLLKRRPDALDTLFKEWSTCEDELPTLREASQLDLRSRRARLEKNLPLAIDYGRRCRLINNEAVAPLIRAFLSTGDIALAIEPLLQMRRDCRRSEGGRARFETARLNLDFHLAATRSVAGMAPADDEFDLDFPAPASIRDPKATAKALRRTRRALRTVQEIARSLDEKLECTSHLEEVRKRQKRIEDIEDALERS